MWKKINPVIHACNHSTEDVETGSFLGCLTSRFSLIMVFQDKWPLGDNYVSKNKLGVVPEKCTHIKHM